MTTSCNCMDLMVVPIHEKPEYLLDCCRLINNEWKRSEVARLRSLECSSDTLPTSLVLLEGNRVIGHAKLSRIPSIGDSCFLESVVIDKNYRGKGLGTFLMHKVEEYCKTKLSVRCVHLSTKGQEGFYAKLGYTECQPISIYGSCNPSMNACITYLKEKNSSVVIANGKVPTPPKMPMNNNRNESISKTYMMKSL